jgi:hypothetical protein
MKIQESMAAVMADVRAVAKSNKNQQQGWSFRGVDAVVNAIGPACRTHGIVIVPTVIGHEVSSIPVSGNKTMRSVVVMVQYEFIGPEGDKLTAVSVGEAFDSGDKATAKAMSVALRTCLLQTFLLPTDEPDPDHDVYEVAPAQKFNPADSTTWPPSLSEPQVKQVVLLSCGGDKALAKDVWQSNFVEADWHGYPASEVEQWAAAFESIG